MNTIDYYKVLQVDPSAEPEVIVAAYRRLSQKYHPDKSEAADATDFQKQLNLAYGILSDPERRKAYDRERVKARAETRDETTEAKTRDGAEAKARARAEAEAKARAEAKSRARAEAEDRARAEDEAEAIAEAKARARRKTKYMVLSILLIIIIGIGITIIYKSSIFSVSVHQSPTPTPVAEVVYEITGTAETVNIRETNILGTTEYTYNVHLPKEYTCSPFLTNDLYVYAENLGSEGSVTVSIYLNGNLIVNSTNSSPYGIAIALGHLNNTIPIYNMNNSNKTVWDVSWHLIETDIHGGKTVEWNTVVGTSQFPATFDYNWGNGKVFDDLSNVGFSANATINVRGPHSESVQFTIFPSSGGATLWVDDIMILSWFSPTNTTTIGLAPGKHKLTFYYANFSYQPLNHVSFNCTADVLKW